MEEEGTYSLTSSAVSASTRRDAEASGSDVVIEAEQERDGREEAEELKLLKRNENFRQAGSGITDIPVCHTPYHFCTSAQSHHVYIT